MPHLNHPEHARLRERMGRVLRQRGRLRHQERIQDEELNSLLTECGALMEARCSGCWSGGRLTRGTGREPNGRGGCLAICWELPLRAPLDDEVLAVLSGQKLKDTRLAIERRNRPFKALWVAVLLCSREYDAHPLRELPARSLQWARMLALTDLRNKGSHASGQRTRPPAQPRHGGLRRRLARAVHSVFLNPSSRHLKAQRPWGSTRKPRHLSD